MKIKKVVTVLLALAIFGLGYYAISPCGGASLTLMWMNKGEIA